jgi:hypothetical protein
MGCSFGKIRMRDSQEEIADLRLKISQIGVLKEVQGVFDKLRGEHEKVSEICAGMGEVLLWKLLEREKIVGVELNVCEALIGQTMKRIELTLGLLEESRTQGAGASGNQDG